MTSRREWTASVGLVTLVLAIFLFGWPGQLGTDIQDRISRGFFFMISVTSLALVALLFTLEHVRPARPDERGFHPSILFDALYMFVQLPIVATIVLLVASPVQDLLDLYAAGLVLDVGSNLPMPLLLLVGVAISDFTLWLSHVIRHKVSFLWRFHIIHHSQTRMSLFTAGRDHPLDTLFETLLRVVPLFFLLPSLVENAQALVLYGLGVSWHIRFTHTNIATNLGPLRWILVTPQSHRIHHSIEPGHWSSNYGNVFCWDRLVGLQHPDDSSYPSTGVNDPNFPEPRKTTLPEFLRCYVRQLWLPFDTQAVSRATDGAPNTALEGYVTPEELGEAA